MIQLSMLDRASIARLWPAIETELDAAPELWETATKAYLRQAALTGEFQVWMLVDDGEGQAFFTTCILSRPAVRTFQVMIGIGEGVLANWALIVRTLREAARFEGCDEIEVLAARGGLVRLLEREGFRVRDVTLVERLAPLSVH